MAFATFLQGVSPFGPIFGKELRITARRKRSYFLRVVYLGALLAVLLLTWSVTMQARRYGAGIAMQNQQQSLLGQEFFACYGIFSVLAMGLLGPILTATAISSERLHKTLPVLLMTPITAWQIVAGKLFSRLLVAMTLIGLGLPVLGMVRLLGGVELDRMLGVVALALVAALSSASIGLFFSTLVNRAYAAMLLSYAVMLLLYLFVPFVIVMIAAIDHQKRGPPVGAFMLVVSINPYYMTVAASIPALMGRMMGGLPWAWCIGSHLALSAVLLYLSAAMLRRRSRREGEHDPNAAMPLPLRAAVPRVVPESDGAATEPIPPPRVDGGQISQKIRASCEVGDNPILWRELRRPLVTRKWQRVVGVCVCLFVLLAIYLLLALNDELGDANNQGGWGCIFNFLFSGLALVISSTAIAQEKEADTWELLLATPVSGWSIVWGKALGVMRRLLWPAVLIAAHFFLFALCQVISFTAALTAVWVILCFNVIWVATGVYFSLRFKKVTTAVIANLALAIAAYLLVWAVLGFATSMVDSFRDFNGLGYMPDFVHPLVVALFWAGTAWMCLAIFLACWRRRGALGHVMVASLFYFITIVLFTAGRGPIPDRRMYDQVGWYAPYFYLSEMRWSARNPGIWLPLEGFRSYAGAGELLAVVLGIGLVHLLLAAVVLAFTSWKFSALVGRARQSMPLERASGHGGVLSDRVEGAT